MKPWTLLLCAALCCTHALATPDLEAREAALADQLRCVVCQNQTVAESQAPIAQDMRKEIAAQLAQGRSDSEVIAFFEQRYGSFVRYAPPWKPSTWVLWCAPFVVLLGGLLLLWRTLRRRSHATSAPPLSAQERQRAQAWLHPGQHADHSHHATPPKDQP